MPFPTAPILDTFNRANENPLGSPWGGNWGDFSGIQLQILTNVVARGGAGAGNQYRSDTTYGPNSEVFLTISTKSSSNIWLGIRLTNIGSGTTDGYILAFTVDAGADLWGIFRLDDGATTQLGAGFTQEVTDGDGIGLEANGSTLSAYYRSGVGGTWTLLATRTDSTYLTAGYIGLFMDASDMRGDDFGGGDVGGGKLTVVATQAQLTIQP